MFWRWWRLDAYDRQRVWPNYGRFSAVFGPSLGMGSTPITREIA